MAYRRVLTIQDISCVGQCSMTVALPILSACGVETCVLPSAVLSAHTGGFQGVTFRDLTEDIPNIAAHWKKEGISFDAVYTGYLGSTRQIGYVKEILNTMTAPGGITVVDPAMADNGRLYTGFDGAYVEAMRGLCAQADIILPNLTEACMLTDTPYTENFDEAWLRELLGRLTDLGSGCVVLTGVGETPGQTGVAIWEQRNLWRYCHEKTAKSYHGTGDIFASAFVGACMQDKSLEEAAVIAADYTALCIRKTFEDPAHWYGVKFETALPALIRMLGLNKY